MVALVGRMPRTRARSPPELEYVTAVATRDREKLGVFGVIFWPQKLRSGNLFNEFQVCSQTLRIMLLVKANFSLFSYSVFLVLEINFET